MNKVTHSKSDSIIKALLKEADSFLIFGKYKEAAGTYNKILTLCPDDHVEYSKLYCDIKIDEEDKFLKKEFISDCIYKGDSVYDPKEKVKFYNKILEINPLQAFDVHDFNLENKYWETIDKIVRIEPQNINAMNRKADRELFGIEIPGDALYPSYDFAIRIYNEVLKIDPTDKHAIHGKEWAKGGREIKKNFNKLDKQKATMIYEANRKSIEIFLTQDFIEGIPDNEIGKRIKADMECKKEKEGQLRSYLKLRKEIESTEKYANWKRIVFENGKNKCVVCGTTENLEAHHIKSFHSILTENKITTLELALFNCPVLWNPDNGAVICKLHHDEMESSKQRKNFD